jgi:4-hydroxybenzoate polyprenyltransferase
MTRLSSTPALRPRDELVPQARRRGRLAALLVSLRPAQWTKNLVVFAGLLFGGRLLEPWAIGDALVAFAAFCALSSAVYLVNDVLDREADQRHPLKRTRPIAAGELPPRTAIAIAIVLGAGAITGSLLVSTTLGAVAGTYIALLVLYTLVLKHMVILDVLTIAAGFVLRAVAGAIAVSVPISQWLLVCTTLLALFLAFSKRRHELTLLAEGATEHRPILGEYSPYLLDQMIAVVTASTVIAYTVYATSPDTAARLGTPYLGLTVPFVLYGIFRYLYLVHLKRGGGNPTTMLLTDRPLLGCVAAWATSVMLILYTSVGR